MVRLALKRGVVSVRLCWGCFVSMLRGEVAVSMRCSWVNVEGDSDTRVREKLRWDWSDCEAGFERSRKWGWAESSCIRVASLYRWCQVAAREMGASKIVLLYYCTFSSCSICALVPKNEKKQLLDPATLSECLAVKFVMEQIYIGN